MDRKFEKRCIEAAIDQAMEAFYVYDSAANYFVVPSGPLRLRIAHLNGHGERGALISHVGSVAVTDGGECSMGTARFVPCSAGDSVRKVAGEAMKNIIDMCNAHSHSMGNPEDAIPEWPLPAGSPLREKPFFADAEAEKSLDKCILAA